MVHRELLFCSIKMPKMLLKVVGMMSILFVVESRSRGMNE